MLVITTITYFIMQRSTDLLMGQETETVDTTQTKMCKLGEIYLYL